MGEQFANQLFVYRRVRNVNDHKTDTFQLEKRHVLRDMIGFEKFSMQFYFKLPHSNGHDASTLIFAKREHIFEFNYETGERTDICTFEVPLNR